MPLDALSDDELAAAGFEHRSCNPKPADGNGRPGRELADGTPSRAAPEAARDTREGPKPRRARPVTIQDIPDWRPFPVELLPDVLGRFVRDTAAALGCDPTFVALPVLCVTAGAVGTTRMIRLKGSWSEPSVLWAAVVARSGSLKSPALDAATKPLRDAQIDALIQHDAAMAQHERELLEYEKQLGTWRKNKGGDAPPEKPERPAAVRCMTSDATTEALACILKDNPRGVLLCRDELSAWVNSFDQYRSKGRGSDAGAWLELWRAGTLCVDRKSGDRKTLYVPRAAVSVVGTIQPGVLRGVLTTEHVESGLAARLLLAAPPVVEKRWSERVPSAAALDEYDRLIRALLALTPDSDERGAVPVTVTLQEDARRAWAAWYDRHARRIADAQTDAEAASLSKIEAAAARLSLVFALAEHPDTRAASADAVRRGCGLADWLVYESKRVYALLGESGESRELRELRTWIAQRGGSVSVRDLTHGLRRYRNRADEAREALDALGAAGVGEWAYPAPASKGGRQQELFELVSGVTVTVTPPDDSAAPGFGDGDSGDTSTTAPHGGGPDEAESGRPADERPPDELYWSAADGWAGDDDPDTLAERAAYGQGAHDCPDAAETGRHGDGVARAESVVPAGWTAATWAARLRHLAGACGAEHPDRAADFRAQADALEAASGADSGVGAVGSAARQDGWHGK